MPVRGAILTFLAALVQQQQMPADPRILNLPYDPNQVVTLAVDPGYAAVVELGPGESVQNVVVGNSSAWQVTANGRGDRVVIKPTSGAAITDMVIVTDEHRYVFLLQAAGGAPSIFVVRFTYADAAPGPSAKLRAATYKVRGARSLYPVSMHDDGVRTTITWPSDAALPAVYAATGTGTETVVDGRMVGRNFVIEGTAPRYVFRLGSAEAIASRRVVDHRR